eukprot:scaffold17431_cov141-Skeletonema_dohrnii-CCMP3373.AAC.4
MGPSAYRIVSPNQATATPAVVEAEIQVFPRVVALCGTLRTTISPNDEKINTQISSVLVAKLRVIPCYAFGTALGYDYLPVLLNTALTLTCQVVQLLPETQPSAKVFNVHSPLSLLTVLY